MFLSMHKLECVLSCARRYTMHFNSLQCCDLLDPGHAMQQGIYDRLLTQDSCRALSGSPSKPQSGEHTL